MHTSHTSTHTSTHLGQSLDALLEGTLAPAEAVQARQHLEDCEHCTKEHARLAGAMAAAQALGKARAPMGFAARVLRRVRLQRHRQLRKIALDQRVPFEGVIVVLLAAAAAAVLVGYGVFSRSAAVAEHQPSTPASSPVAR
jgi:anti-sigma factor RsiW